MRHCLFLLAIFALLSPARADQIQNRHQFADEEAVVLKPDRAYLLIRATVVTSKSIWTKTLDPGRFFIRVLTPGELADVKEQQEKSAVEPNFLTVSPDGTYAKSGEDRLYLVEVMAGEYVLSGPGELCMGTVKFKAKPNVITDLGYINWGLSTRWPHDSGALQGKHYTVSVRPYADGMFVPSRLANLPREAADYRATSFAHYLASIIDRVEPIAGVIDYTEDGDIIDLKR